MKILNCLGMRCPLPIIYTARAAQELKVDECLTLLADDPATEPDLHAWARMTGNTVEIMSSTEFKVIKRALTLK